MYIFLWPFSLAMLLSGNLAWLLKITMDFPIDNNDFPIDNDDFPIETGDFTIENCDFPVPCVKLRHISWHRCGACAKRRRVAEPPQVGPPWFCVCGFIHLQGGAPPP